jgi:hypothetical protein
MLLLGAAELDACGKDVGRFTQALEAKMGGTSLVVGQGESKTETRGESRVVAKMGGGAAKVRQLPSGEYVRVEGSKALVVMFGWWLASPRHLKKYADLWNKEGCSTLSMILPPAAMLTPGSVRKVTAKFEAVLRSSHPKYWGGIEPPAPDCPVIIHCWSNNGMFLLDDLVRFAEERREANTSSRSDAADSTLERVHIC